MLNIEDKSYKPTISEIFHFVQLPLFQELYEYMLRKYQANVSIEYSGDKSLLGWNVKYKKAGRTLCTVYPRKGHFPLLLVVGRKEKEQTEEWLPELSEEFRQIFLNTKEGMGQRWLLFDFFERTQALDDALKIIDLRKNSSKSKESQKSPM